MYVLNAITDFLVKNNSVTYPMNNPQCCLYDRYTALRDLYTPRESSLRWKIKVLWYTMSSPSVASRCSTKKKHLRNKNEIPTILSRRAPFHSEDVLLQPKKCCNTSIYRSTGRPQCGDIPDNPFRAPKRLPILETSELSSKTGFQV